MSLTEKFVWSGPVAVVVLAMQPTYVSKHIRSVHHSNTIHPTELQCDFLQYINCVCVFFFFFDFGCETELVLSYFSFDGVGDEKWQFCKH